MLFHNATQIKDSHYHYFISCLDWNGDCLLFFLLRMLSHNATPTKRMVIIDSPHSVVAVNVPEPAILGEVTVAV